MFPSSPFTRPRLFCALAVAFCIGLHTSPAFGQTDDPCLEDFADEPAALEQYDALVAEFLHARDEGDAFTQLEVLDDIEALCSKNLRIGVFRGEAYASTGRCEDAAAAYVRVKERARDRGSTPHAADATARADAGLDALREQCLAEVSVECGPQGARVQIGDSPSKPCPAEFQVGAGRYQVVVSMDGMEPIRREYTFDKGTSYIDIEPLSPLQATATVSFVCDDPNTQIALGASRFPCPATRTVEAGVTHEFQATRPDGSTHAGEVATREGEHVEVRVPAAGSSAATPGAGGAQLNVDCTPPGAQVELTPAGGAAQIARCPFQIAVAPGHYTVLTTAEGHRPDTREVTIGKGERVALAVALDSHPLLDVLLRAAGGAGLTPTDEASSDEGVTAASDDGTGSIVGAVAVDAAAAFYLTENVLLAVGGRGRFAFGGSDTGLAGFGLVDVIGRFDGLLIYLGAVGGYGSLGVNLAEVQQGETETESLETEPYGGLGGAHLGIGLNFSQYFAILTEFGAIGGNGFLSVDFLFGIEVHL